MTPLKGCGCVGIVLGALVMLVGVIGINWAGASAYGAALFGLFLVSVGMLAYGIGEHNNL